MTDRDDIIAEIVARIRGSLRAKRIVLYGSRARGDGRADSDYDVLVVSESDEPRYRRSAPLYAALADLPVEVEPVVYTPEEIEEWSEVPQALVSTALREGIVVYEEQA